MAVSTNSLLTSGIDLNGVVRYDRVQVLTETERDRVRQDIGAPSSTSLASSFASLSASISSVASLLYADTISSRDLLGPTIQATAGARAFVFVADASADAAVESGWALYLAKIEGTTPVFTKVAEAEGFFVTDVDFAALYNQSK